MHTLKTESFAGGTIKIIPDDDPESPREMDNTGIMVCWHRTHPLGDKHSFASPLDFEEWAAENTDEIVARLPLFLYDHSGITMSTGSFDDRWDAGQVGWIYATRESIRKIWGDEPYTEAQIVEALESEVKIYDTYITGGYVGYVIEDEDGHTLDSCWGFDDADYCMVEARSSAEYYADKHATEQARELAERATFAGPSPAVEV